MAIRAIIFDFGNVLSSFDKGRTTRRLALYSPYPVEELHSRLFDARCEDSYESGLISTDAFVQQLKETGRLSCDAPFIADAWGDIFTPNVETCRLTAKLAKRYRLLLGSNTNDLHARWFIPEFKPVFASFRACILSHEIGVRKPDRRFYDACLRRAECSAEECVFIDDIANNVAGAQAVGMHGITYHGYNNLLEELAHLTIRPEL